MQNSHFTTSSDSLYGEWVNSPPSGGSGENECDALIASDLYSFLLTNDTESKINNNEPIGNLPDTLITEAVEGIESVEIMQQHLIAQQIALQQIQRDQHSNKQINNSNNTSIYPREGQTFSANEPTTSTVHSKTMSHSPVNRSKSETTTSTAHSKTMSHSSVKRSNSDPRPNVVEREDSVVSKNESTTTFTTTPTSDDDDDEIANVKQAEERLANGQCPSCGQQLYQIKRGGLKWIKFLKAYSCRSIDQDVGSNSTKSKSKDATPEDASANGNRRKPLHIPGVVHQGQCVKCSNANNNDDEEEEEDVNPFLQDEEYNDEDDYLQNSILNPLVNVERPPSPPQREALPSVAKYTGPVDELGRRHGQGKLKWSNGDVYEGNFVHGVRHGPGSLTFGGGGGGEYVGDWEDNLMHGTGTRRFANGDLYTGPYVRGRRHGANGRFYFANGDLYVGQWEEDMLHGTGRYYYHHGQRFEGDFVKGVRHGKGKLQRLDGSLDIYLYQANVRRGPGVRFSADRLSAWKLIPATTTNGNRDQTDIHVKKKKITIAEAVSVVYEIEQTMPSPLLNTSAALTSDLPTTQQGTNV